MIIQLLKSVVAATALLVMCASHAGAQAADSPVHSGDSGFSFAVYGDSRSMMYVPYKLEQKDEASKMIVDMFNLILPEKESEELVRKNVKLTSRYRMATQKINIGRDRTARKTTTTQL